MTAAQAKQPSLDAPSSEWLVYADALQEARDPRGELIVLNHAVESGKTPAADRDAYVAKHAEALLGKGANAESYRLGWKHCFIDSADVLLHPEDAADKVIDTLFSSPAAANIRSVSLVGVPKGETRVDLSKAMEVLASKLPKTCKSVAFVDDRAAKTTMLASRDFDPDQNLVQLGDLAPFFANPNIESIELTVADSEQVGLGNINAPNLKSFTLSSLRYGVDPYNDETVSLTNTLANATWPRLESLAVRLTETWMANVIEDSDAYVSHYAGNEDWEDRMDEAEDGENEGVNWRQLRGLFDSLKKTPLKRLALTSFDSASTLLDCIEQAGLPPKLEELDLSDSSLSDAEWFTKNKELIAPLKRLVLERTTMSDEDAKKLATLGPEIKHSSGHGARYRYVVGSE